MSFFSHFIQFTVLNGVRKFLKQKITRIQNQYGFSTFSNLFYPSSPSGETAKTILQVSGGTGFDLSINIVAIKNRKAFDRALGLARNAIHPKNPENQEYYKEPSPFHLILPFTNRFHYHFLSIYTPFNL